MIERGALRVTLNLTDRAQPRGAGKLVLADRAGDRWRDPRLERRDHPSFWRVATLTQF